MLEGKKVLLTGHTGQIAYAVAQYWGPRAEVWGLARYTAPGAREATERLGVKPVVCDFTTGDFTGVPDDFDYVVHFAANTWAKTQDESIVDNVEGTGLLLHHCRKAKAFLHVSTTGVYHQEKDPYHAYKETDRIDNGTEYSPFYGSAKTMTEGVVRAMGRAYDLPTTIARMNVSYGGPQHDGGLPGGCLEKLVTGMPITIPKSWPLLHMPIHEDDICVQVGALLGVANVRSTIVNWGGDDVVSVEEFTDHMAQLTGLEPIYNRTDDRPVPNGVLDTTRRLELIGPCKVKWRDGMRRMISARHPELKLRDVPAS